MTMETIVRIIMEYNNKNEFNQFLMFVTFQYRGFNHLELPCI